MSSPGKPTVLPNTTGFPAQRASNAESAKRVPMPRRHHTYSANSLSLGSMSLESSYARAKTSDARPEPCQQDQIHPLQWRHNERDGVSNHQRLDGLFNCFLGHRSKKISKLRVTGLYEGISPITGEFPSQRASNAENVSIWWRHHALQTSKICQILYSWYELLMQIIDDRGLMITVAKNYRTIGDIFQLNLFEIQTFPWRTHD